MKKKRLVSLFLCLCMLITMFPTTVSAAQGNRLSTTAQTTYEQSENPFTDVEQSDWFYSAVQYSRENGFFSGSSTTTFEPNRTMTRGMFITVLGRMAGVDTANYKGVSAYSDVAEDAYYAPYVAWASKHGITVGVGGGKFAPNKLINRQQMAVFFVRYFETFDVDYKTETQINTRPADIDKVSKYAKDAVLKLWKNGLLVGDGVNFKPLSNASRAQAAMLCMRTDKAVETWYKEPGVAKKETAVVTPPSSSDSSSAGGSSGGSSTVYCGVTLTARGESITKLYPAGTLLNTMPTPAQEGGTVFLGWYYDKELTNMVVNTDTLVSNLTLYAKFTEAVSLNEDGELNFVTKQDAAANLAIIMSADSTPISGADFKFRNITDPSVTDGTEGVEQETLSLTGSSGSFMVTSANGGFTPGHTYQIELLNDAVTFDGESKEIRYYNFIIQKDEVMKLTLNDEIKYIAASDLSETDRNNVLEYAGLYQAVTDAQGETTYTANNGTGSFTYSAGGITEGDTIAIYTGDKPDERTVEDKGAVSYLKITGIDGTTYYYQSAESEDVLFTPDLLPIDLDTGDGVTAGNTVVTSGTGNITIDSSKLEFSDTVYADMGLGADTVVEPGDYLGFFNNGNFGDENASKQGYGLIIDITTNDGSTIITYNVVEEEDVLSAMELYSESELTEEEIDASYDEQLIREEVESQLMSSGFIQEAGEYLAGLAIQTDEVKEIFNSGDNLNLSDYTITYSDGTPISEDDLALMGNIVDKEGGVKTSVSVSPRLAHFEGKKGVRVEVAVIYKFDIQKTGINKKVEVELTAFFEQEVVFGFSVSGGAVWKWKWKIFPYISDYRMTGNIDLGTYTGVGITATAKLVKAKEPWGMPWPNSVKEAQAAKKIFSLSESIKEMMEEAETVFPEAEGSASGGLAEKYAELMEDANKKWTDLFVVNLIDLRGGVDPLHLLGYGIQVDFVVSANLNVAIGMTFQYENSKRHSFTMSLKNKKADSETIDLSTNGYQFDFYVMGTLGIRAGVRAKALVGLFSTKLNGIGLQIEAGAYARLWGYFYYSLTNYKIGGVWVKNSNSSGAMLVEIGAYLDVKFVAEVLNGKYSYAPTIYAKEWPFWSAGQRENVYDFAYEKAPTYSIQNVTTYTLPTTVYEMKWMDLKTGDIGTDENPITKNFDAKTAHNTDDEKYFAVELSNPAFTYNPVNNQITVSRDSGDSTLNCEMKLTWKGAPLAFSTETLSRTITLTWSDVINGKTMVFESNGGTPVDMICKLAGANISALKPANPSKTGFTFAGWYTNSDFTGTAYTIPNTMPNGNVKLYAKWTPTVVAYTVEHYQQDLDGMYVLVDRQMMSGTAELATNAQAKSYTGFTPKTIIQKTIQADGNTVVQVYYERNTYTLTFSYGVEGDNRSVAIKYPMGAKIEASNPTIPGYSFLRWNSSIPAVMPANDLTITAVWATRQDTKYSVEHYQESLTEGSFVLTETEFKEGSSNTAVTPEVKNYAGFTAPSVQMISIKGDGSAVVKYYYTRNNYTLTYMLGNGEDDVVLTVKFGDLVKKQIDPSRTGYSFTGWKEDGEATSIPTTMPARDVTLNAQWNGKQYTITFDSNGGSLVSPITQEYGTIVTEPSAPTKTGYTFTGWKQNNDEYIFDKMPAEDITLVAVWSDIPTYTVSFHANGGTVNVMSKPVVAGSSYGELPIPSFEGHYFLGWFTAESGGTKITSTNNVELFTDHTLYARWSTTGFTGEVNANLVLYVAGIKVTTENMNDILGNGSGSVQFDPSSTVSSDGYITTAGTLYLNNATIEGNYRTNYVSAAIYSERYLTIVNTGDSSVINNFNEEAAVSNVCGIYTNSGLNFIGTGTLTVVSGTGGSNSNCGIRYGLNGNNVIINGPTVKTFGGIAGSGGKSYGVCVGTEGIYCVELRKGTLETHGYDSAAYCGPPHDTVNYFIDDGTTIYSTIFTTITVSNNYDGSSAFTVPQDNSYRDYKYIIVTNP